MARRSMARAAACLVLALASTLFGGAAAYAGQADGGKMTSPSADLAPPTIRETRFTSGTFTAASVRADQLAVRGAALGMDLVKARARVAEKLADSARVGVLLDEKQLRVAALPDPYEAGSQIYTVWDGPKTPKTLTYARADFAGGASQVGMGIEWDDGDNTDQQLSQAPPSLPSSGYGAGTNLRNMYKWDSWNGCTTTWFVPSYAAQKDHKLVDCWEKWAQSGTVHWIYNRWALWTPGEPTYWWDSYVTDDFTIRARPDKNNKWKVAKLNKWEPLSLTANCYTAATVKLGGTYNGVTGEISIPVNKCEYDSLQINTVDKSIGIDYLSNDNPSCGSQGRKGQMFLEVAGDYNAYDNRVIPTWADYNWVSVSRYNIDGECWRHSYLRKDSSWN